ncbi:SRPBCC family protein [Jatrophihabitans sp. DSM 45814]
MTTQSTRSAVQAATTQVYSVYIKTTPQAIWDAITKPEWTERYGYGGRAEFDLRPGGVHRLRATSEIKAAGAAGGHNTPDVMVDGEVLESDPPRKLVISWRMLMDPDLASEGFTRLTYEIDPITDDVTKLTVVHALENAPKLALLVGGALEHEGAGGGHAWVLSDLKSLLETGVGLNQQAG